MRKRPAASARPSTRTWLCPPWCGIPKSAEPRPNPCTRLARPGPRQHAGRPAGSAWRAAVRRRRKEPVMERVLFGDNQFFGINHMSEEKALAQAMKFQNTSAIIDVIDAAHDAGIRVFMCTTHERIAEICDHVRANPDKY